MIFSLTCMLFSILHCRRLFLRNFPLDIALEPYDGEGGKDRYCGQYEPWHYVRHSRLSLPLYTKPAGVTMLTGRIYHHSAGACGVKRTLELPHLATQNYLSRSPFPYHRGESRQENCQATVLTNSYTQGTLSSQCSGLSARSP